MKTDRSINKPFLFFRGLCISLFVVEIALCVLQLPLPGFRWARPGRSRLWFPDVPFAASWLAGIQFFGIGVLALLSFHRERQRRTGSTWIWLLGGVGMLLFSFAEVSRCCIHPRLTGFTLSHIYGRISAVAGSVLLLGAAGWFLMNRLSSGRRSSILSLIGWTLCIGIAQCIYLLAPAARQWGMPVGTLLYLGSGTLLFLGMGSHILRPERTPQVTATPAIPFPQGRGRILIMAGLGGVSFILISLELILFQLLIVFTHYLAASSIIAIALLGGAWGGIIGFFAARPAPLRTMIGCSLLLPSAILLAFGVVVTSARHPVLSSLLLMLPFILASTVIAIALTRTNSHLAYCVTLLGAGLGALFVNSALTAFREEGSMFIFAGLAFLVAGCFIGASPPGKSKKWLFVPVVAGAVFLSGIGALNTTYDWMNVVRYKVRQQHRRARVLFSRSSFIGRYDIIRQRPLSTTLQAYENGRASDTVRPLGKQHHQIDPRIPNSLFDNPRILIIGLAGDGITKSARFLSTEIDGIEINPDVVALQQNELVPLNDNSYEGINVIVMDGRSFIEQTRKRYDIITLLNTHCSRGATEGRAPGPEYLFTAEALHAYLDRLTDNGIISVEEVVKHPGREPAVWKLLYTMRHVLSKRGNAQPEQHFFVFQWKTHRNNYYQIVMKKTRFTDTELARVLKWVHEVDNKEALEKKKGLRLGPISTKTTVLYRPGEESSTTISSIIKGTADPRLLNAHNIHVLTDNRPFMFNVDPSQAILKKAYTHGMLLVLLLVPVLFYLLLRNGSRMTATLPHLLAVALSGLGYLLIEIILIQRYEIFLGSPVVTFSSVLGTLLVSSGIGSLWSGRIPLQKAYRSLLVLLAVLLLHQYAAPLLFPFLIRLGMPLKTAVVTLSMVPLGFLLGIPFPFVLRMGKEQISESLTALLYAINAATGALAAVLAFNISAALGFQVTFLAAIAIYGVIWLLFLGMQKHRMRKSVNAAGILVIITLLISPWLLSHPGAASPSSVPAGGPRHSPLYRVYALEYGSSFYPKDEVLYKASPQERVWFSWMFWLIQKGDMYILVDTGFFDPALARERGFTYHLNPVERLGELGISPSEIDDVIITHVHWDHIGTLNRYPNAIVWIQQKEYAYARSLLERKDTKSRLRRYLNAIMQAEREGRLNIVQGHTTMLPGIALDLAGGHTPGSQYVTVQTLSGPVILADDETYLYQNNQWHTPVGTAYNRAANLAAIQSMHKGAASPLLIVPGHDPRVMFYFPKAGDGIVEITTVSDESRGKFTP
ncbi:MAG: MBL fold metallo-hydrolase [Candidatus Omnitrophica bacterium]|nr:MBL fold metallo-hydrolase [Candidatus Omnitrophota bacterium]